jgi:glycosyltransferase involved in cell wall biosynthesis
MKIAIVCGHFIPNMGYVEVHLAKAFVRLGHEVLVVTSTSIPAYVSHLYKETGKDPDGVKVIRLKPVFQLGQIVLCKGIVKNIRAFQPDLVVAIGLGKGFPKPIFNGEFKVVSLFGDNAHSYVDTTFKAKLKTKLLFTFFKKRTYIRAIDKSDLLMAYTPESFEAAAKMVGGARAEVLRKQKQFISLGFWPDEFNYNPSLKGELHKDLGLPSDAKICITATRIKPEKELDKVLEWFVHLPKHYVWLMIGGGDDAYAKNLLAQAEKVLGKNRVKMLPHADRTTINRYYNLADLAIFTVPAISIFEALGTGLPVVSPLHEALKHIPGEGIEMVNGSENRIVMLEEIIHLDATSEARENRAVSANKRFAWPEISAQILAAAKQ